MEDKPKRKCMNVICSQPGTYYCSGHKKTYCHECLFKMHLNCETLEIRDFTEALEKVEFLRHKIKRVEDFDKIYDLNSQFVDFRNYLESYRQQADELLDSINTSIEEDEFYKRENLTVIVVNTTKEFVQTQMYKDYINFKEDLESCSWYGDINMNKSQGDQQLAQIVESAKEELAKLGQDREVLEELKVEIFNLAEINFAEAIQKQIDDVSHKIAKAKEIRDRNVEIKEKLQNKLDQLNDEFEEVKENPILSDDLYDQIKASDYKIVKNLADGTQLSEFKELCKWKMPSLKKLWIDNPRCDIVSFKKFLMLSFPEQVELFRINYQ